MRRVEIRIALSAFLLTFGACQSSHVPQQALQQSSLIAQPKPSWVEQQPVSNLYYVGVAMARKAGSPDYVELAKRQALHSLASEISITVSGSSILYQLDHGNSFKEEYLSGLKTSVNKELEGYELAGSWENEQEYWVYYRLDKSKWLELQQTKKQNALRLASNHYQQALHQEQEGQVWMALNNCLSGLDALKPYFAEALETDINGQRQVLASELLFKMQQMAGKVMLKPEQDQLTIRREELKHINIPVKAFYTSKIVPALPVEYMLTADGVEIKGVVKTSQSGELAIPLNQVTARQGQIQVLLQPQWSALLPQPDAASRAILNSLSAPAAKVTVKTLAPAFYVVSSEANQGRAQASPILKNEVRRLLAQQGYRVVDKQEQANYVVNVLADTKPGSVTSGMYTALLDATVEVRQMNNEVVFSSNLSSKGIQLNYDQAGADAYKKALPRLQEELVPNLLQQLF